MGKMRQKFTAEFKSKVALAAIKGDRTLAELAGQFQVHPHQVTAWKKQALAVLPEVFSRKRDKDQARRNELQDELYGQIGRLKVELDWLKKNLDWSPARKRQAIEPGHRSIPASRQCELLGLPRSSLYYRSAADESENLMLMRLMDRQYLATPFYGVLRMTAWLVRQGHGVNVKRVRRLMRLMGLAAIYPKPQKNSLSKADREARKYPYLLRRLTIDRPDQAWAADITYVPLLNGWMYLVAILDWFSRHVVAWELSLTLETDFCLSALARALGTGRQPGIFNTDQGCQFTSGEFTGMLKGAGVAISMDGRGRAFDNIFVERLWRSVKYENVYINDYQTPGEAQLGLDRYFKFYNQERLHQALQYRTPAEVYGADGADTPGKIFAAAGRGLLPPRPLPAAPWLT